MINVCVYEKIDRVWIAPIHDLGFYASYEQAGAAAELFWETHRNELTPVKRFVCQSYNTDFPKHGNPSITHWETDRNFERLHKRHYGDGWEVVEVSEDSKKKSLPFIKKFRRGAEMFVAAGQLYFDLAGLKNRKVLLYDS